MTTLQEVLQVSWDSLKDLWEELLPLSLMNLFTVAPIILLFFLLSEAITYAGSQQMTRALVCSLLGILPLLWLPAAMVGLWSAANRAADGLVVKWSDYFAGSRRYFWKAWSLTLVDIIVLAILASNIWFYAPNNNPITAMSDDVSAVIQIIFIVKNI